MQVGSRLKNGDAVSKEYIFRILAAYNSGKIENAEMDYKRRAVEGIGFLKGIT